MGISRFYPFNDETRVNRVVEILKPHVEGSALDVGCHNGGVTRRLSDTIVGIDVVMPPQPVVPVSLYDGLTIPFPDRSFDTVVCSFVLHHSKDPARLLAEMKRVGKRVVVFEDVYDNVFDRRAVIASHWLYYYAIGMTFEKAAFRPRSKWIEFFQAGGMEIRELTRHNGIVPFWPFMRHDLYVLTAAEPAKPN